MAQFSLIRCPLLVAHCLGMRLVAMSQAKADPRLAVCAFVLVLIAMLAGCAGVQRPQSTARIDGLDTRLATVAHASMPERQESGGVRGRAEPELEPAAPPVDALDAGGRELL
jgi:hypothetical protein